MSGPPRGGNGGGRKQVVGKTVKVVAPLMGLDEYTNGLKMAVESGAKMSEIEVTYLGLLPVALKQKNQLVVTPTDVQVSQGSAPSWCIAWVEVSK